MYKGVENLYERLERMSLMKPFWIDVTWGAGGSTSKLTLEICQTAQNFVGLETMMHLTCTNMPISEFKDALTKAKENGIRNILALRGGIFFKNEKYLYIFRSTSRRRMETN